MKTTLTELIEELKKDEINSQNTMERVSIRNCIIIATSLLEKEKQQIIDAYNCGWQYGFLANEKYPVPTKNSEQYYSETFKNND